MKVVLSMELSEKDMKDEGLSTEEADVKENLTRMLFEVCEDWVLRAQVPSLDFENTDEVNQNGKGNNSQN